ncbi:MAG: MATE family efflux transporter [Pontiellaceae bacterium]|nr:MATE family efflux transporter [Pontiellaceae bacterium]
MSKLLHGNVAGHLARLTLPSIGGMFALMVFNLTDTWFVSRMGKEPLAAMGFTFSVVMMVGALAIGFSTGAASIISRAIGSGDKALARRTVSDGLFLTILGTIVVSTVGLLSIRPLFEALGAEGHVLELVIEYMQVWFIGAVVAMMPPVCDSCLRAGGDMIRPLLVMTTCALMNVILDPILIFGWGPFPEMGMRGAALATIIARSVGMITSFSFLHFRSRLVAWKLPRISEMLHSWKEILTLGIPASLTQVLNPVVQAVCMRIAAGAGGDAGVTAVAAMTTGSRIENFIFIIAIAYGIAIVPFVGQNYGAQAYDRVRTTHRLSIRLAVVYAGISWLILLPLARPLSGLFSSDPGVLHLSTVYLLIATLGHAGFYISNWMSQLLNVVGKPLPVLAINLCRVFLLVVPLCLMGNLLFGFYGLVSGIALGNLLAGVLAHYATHHQLKETYVKIPGA